ncbi:hypothetical protein FOMPIDRAFT_1039772 [Fomitopsis schrenkii]|uniref:Fucose-specific lectin n=1 Tax=Fomitopsis schrenkii TaxID=2126942 RepID=S8EKV7_FOMSC|nr:hypothetical protein FOMPIDRAFT_1039772 [Fomitopsis schrenkii]
MSQMKDIARGLAANGAAARRDNDGYYLLFTDSGRFVVKHWTGGAFSDEQLVTTSARPGSTAAYIHARAGNPRPLAICVSSASHVAVFQFDEEEEEWTQDDTFPDLAVHPSGKLAAVLWEECVHIVCQGTSGELVHVTKPTSGGAWAVAPLQAAIQPRPGTALCFSHPDGGDIFYISAADDYVHHICETTGWVDGVVAQAQVEPLKQLFVASSEKKDFFEAYALTQDDAVLHIPSGGEKTVTGRVNQDGSYVSATKAEWSININIGCVIA